MPFLNFTNSGIGPIGKPDMVFGADLSIRMFLANGNDNPSVDNDDFYPVIKNAQRAEFTILNYGSSSLGQKPNGQYVSGWTPNQRNVERSKQLINAFPRRMLQDLILVPGKDGTGVPVAGAYFTKLLDHTPGTLEPLSALITDADGYIDTIRVNNLIADNIGDGGDGSGLETTWTNSTPTTQTVGGVTSGSSLVGQNAIQILETMLYAYQSVSLTSFNISGLSSPVEIGSTIGSGVFAASWSASNSSNINTNGMSINYSGNLGSGNIASGFNYSPTTRNITLPSFTTNSINNTITFTLTADQIQGADVTRSTSVQWRSKIYYGKGYGNLTSQSPITTSLLQYGNSQFIDTTSNPTTNGMEIGQTESGGPGFIYIFVHNNFTLSTISIGTTDNTGAFELLGTFSIQNAFNTAQYKIYKSYNEINGAVTLKVT